jgi:hypothetical protein
MKIDIIEIQEDDKVIVNHNIEGLPLSEVDKYCSKLLPQLVSIFGKGRVSLFPVREGDTWNFLIVRKLPKKKI